MSPRFYVIIGFVFAIIALLLSAETSASQSQGLIGGTSAPGFYDIAADGGALGFAILAGCCFIASAIVKSKEQLEYKNGG